MTSQRYLAIKRTIDVTVALAAIILTAPLQLLIATAIRLHLGRPVLFRQERPGQDARLFTLVKFRTMLEPDPQRELVADADRLTAFGKFLRATSLDELPTLWNVLSGDMSLVGPRPLLPEYLPRYSRRQARRHEVRPGITGLAQASGRNSLDWDTRLELDVKYVDSVSMRLDARIIAATIKTVVLRRDISHPGHATMVEFTGSKSSVDEEA